MILFPCSKWRLALKIQEGIALDEGLSLGIRHLQNIILDVLGVMGTNRHLGFGLVLSRLRVMHLG